MAAFFSMRTRIRATDSYVPINVTVPLGTNTKKPPDGYPVIWLIHGVGGDDSIWSRMSSIERYADEAGVALVMPDGRGSWYLNSARGDFETYLLDELPEIVHTYFPTLSRRREDNMIAGFSMGGYGALHTALKRPSQYGAVACLSGAFEIEDPKRNAGLIRHGILTGSPVGTDADVYYLAGKEKPDGDLFPVFLACGTEDKLLGANRRMRDVLTAAGYPVTYSESKGVHAWSYWDGQSEKMVRWWRDLRAETSGKGEN